jgi:hypothetical protein
LNFNLLLNIIEEFFFEASDLKAEAGFRYEVSLALLKLHDTLLKTHVFLVKAFNDRGYVNKDAVNFFECRDEGDFIDHHWHLLFELLQKVLVITAFFHVSRVDTTIFNHSFTHFGVEVVTISWQINCFTIFFLVFAWICNAVLRVLCRTANQR